MGNENGYVDSHTLGDLMGKMKEHAYVTSGEQEFDQSGQQAFRSFHAKDGWWFERSMAGGHVIVTKKTENGEPVADYALVVFTPQEWASIVATVSREGENIDTWQAALDRQLPG